MQCCGRRGALIAGLLALWWTLAGAASAQPMPATTGAAAAAAGSSVPPMPVLTEDVRRALRLAASPARGREAWEACVQCHRRDAWGRINGSTPRLSGQHAAVMVRQMIDVRAGRRVNEAMKEVLDDHPLDDQTLVDIAAHVQALPMASRVGRGNGQALEHGQTLYTRDCAGCHGGQGQGDAQRLQPMLAGQHYLWLRAELQRLGDGQRGNADHTMVDTLRRYTPADRDAVADHLSRLAPP
jgi:cytochrome c553